MVIHHVFANKSNIGDWLSAIGIQRLLAPHAIVEHLCDEPFVPETLAALEAASPDDLIVIGGGGLFMDYFFSFWEGFNKIAGKTPYCLWGVGFCDSKREATCPPLSEIREIVERSQFCFVRDDLSLRYLSNLAFPKPKGCPSVVAVMKEPSRIEGLVHVDNYTTAGADVFARMDQIARDYAGTTRRPYRRTNNRISAGNVCELHQTLEEYRSSDIVVSSGLHGCVIAVAMGKRVIAVSGDWKIESFMNAVGLKAWVLDVDEVEKLPLYLENIFEQNSPSQAIDRMEAEQLFVRDQILGVIKNKT